MNGPRARSVLGCHFMPVTRAQRTLREMAVRRLTPAGTPVRRYPGSHGARAVTASWVSSIGDGSDFARIFGARAILVRQLADEINNIIRVRDGSQHSVTGHAVVHLPRTQLRLRGQAGATRGRNSYEMGELEQVPSSIQCSPSCRPALLGRLAAHHRKRHQNQYHRSHVLPLYRTTLNAG